VNITAGLVDKLDEVLDTGMAVRFDGRWLDATTTAASSSSRS
jgi:hypothetical protein